jgi:WD40 repeat protein
MLSCLTQCTAISPEAKLMAIAGDCIDTVITSVDSGQQIAVLRGHADYSFACAWSPDGSIIATGNQDKTTRLWDVRNYSKSLTTIPSKMSAVRSLHFSAKGVLAIAEAADFVHLWQAYEMQTIDFFGDIAGVCFGAGGDCLWICNADDTYGGIMEYISDELFL